MSLKGIPHRKWSKEEKMKIRNQLKEDELSNQLTMEESDPFTGGK